VVSKFFLSALSVSKIPENLSPSAAGGTYAADYT
jgi:hypothetical protein